MIAFVGGRRRGHRARSPAPPPPASRWPPSSRRPTPPPARGRAAEDAAELVARPTLPPTGTTRPATTDIHVFDAFAPALGEAFGAGRRRRTGALRLRQPRGHHHLPRLLHRAAAAPRPAHRSLRLHRQDRRPDQQRLGRRRHPRLLRRRRRAVDGRARPAARLGRAAGRPAGRALRHDPAADRGRRPDDRRLLVRRRPRRPRGPVRLQPARRRHPDRRADRARRASHLLLRPGLPGLECAPFVVAASSDNTSRSSTTGCRSARTDWIARRAPDLAAPDPAHRRADRPAGHSRDRQPGARGRRRRRRRSTTSWPAPSAGCC